MRRLVAIHACFLLLLGSLQLPLLHLHRNQEHHHGPNGGHEHSPVVHSHLPQEPAVYEHDDESLGLAHEDHDAEELAAFALQGQERPPLTPANIEATIPAVVLLDLGGAILESVVRGHDPPSLDSGTPRAPPA
jgi:hypothetical protein